MPTLAIVAFKRIIFQDWATIIGIVSFVVVGTIFLIGSIRALFLPKAKREHLANLPLDGDTTSPPSPPPPSQDSTSPPN